VKSEPANPCSVGLDEEICMQPRVICRPSLRVNAAPSTRGLDSVSICLDSDSIAFLANRTTPGELLKTIFRVTIGQEHSPECDSLPDVSGRCVLFEDEVQFIPHFPFERDMKYRARFDPRPLGAPLTSKSLDVEFLIPSEPEAVALTEVMHVFPSCDILPENLLRFYVCFSNPMQRGRALDEVALLDSDGQPVVDALYRTPVELWDRSMRHLTVLLDPGRLKRWVGPNVALGPPLKMGHEYTLEIRSGMVDLHGRPLHECFRKHFAVGDAVREKVSIEHWKIQHPVTGSRHPLVLMFPRPLDWALLLRTITIESADRGSVDGRVVLDQWERRWNFIPTLPWIAGVYHIRFESCLEDVCGNSITGLTIDLFEKRPNKQDR
jgi:hypothetical protein